MFTPRIRKGGTKYGAGNIIKNKMLEKFELSGSTKEALTEMGSYSLATKHLEHIRNSKENASNVWEGEKEENGTATTRRRCTRICGLASN
jgi:hypothetical protein